MGVGTAPPALLCLERRIPEQSVQLQVIKDSPGSRDIPQLNGSMPGHCGRVSKHDAVARGRTLRRLSKSAEHARDRDGRKSNERSRKDAVSGSFWQAARWHFATLNGQSYKV